MELTKKDKSLIVVRETDDQAFYASRSSWGDAESAFLYNVKLRLNRPDCKIFPLDSKNRPIVWIKKRMWKDGHMVDEMQQYLRERKPSTDGRLLCMYNYHWAISGLDEDLKGSGAIVIPVVNIGKQPEVTGEVKKHIRVE